MKKILGLILFSLMISTAPQQANATCNDCISSYRACLARLQPISEPMFLFPVNWVAGGPARCIANRNSCLKGCGFKTCKSSCKETKRVEKEFCEQRFAETKCGVKDRVCKRKARQLKNQCIQDARTKKGDCVTTCKHQSDSDTQSNIFNVKVLNVDKSGMATFQLKRNQGGRHCNKIKMIRTNGGQFPDYIMPTPLCSFTKDLKVQVFPNLDCRKRNSASVKFELFSVKHPGRTGTWQHWNNRGEQTVQVNSDFVCKRFGGNSGTANRTHIPRRVQLPAACNMSGWWKLSPGPRGMVGEWQFDGSGSTRAVKSYTTTGPTPSRYIGMPKYGHISGTASVQASKSFTWNIEKGLHCSGHIDNACKKVTGRCQVKGRRGASTFTLVKSNGPQAIRTRGNNPGKPTGVTNPAGTRKSPHLPPRW